MHRLAGMHRLASDDSRRQRRRHLVVGGFLVSAMVVVSAWHASSGGAALPWSTESLASELYAWTNWPDKSRGHVHSSIISGLDADDPAFAPRASRVPPVDRVVRRLKGQFDPEFYDAEHHGAAGQYVNGVPKPAELSVAAPEDEPEQDSDFVVDPDDDSQFSINLLLRKSGRMSRDAGELAKLQAEDQGVTAQYDRAKKHSQDLLTLEGDIKAELQALSAKQMSILKEIANITQHETNDTLAEEDLLHPAKAEKEEGSDAGEEGGEEVAAAEPGLGEEGEGVEGEGNAQVGETETENENESVTSEKADGVANEDQEAQDEESKSADSDMPVGDQEDAAGDGTYDEGKNDEDDAKHLAAADQDKHLDEDDVRDRLRKLEEEVAELRGEKGGKDRNDEAGARRLEGVIATSGDEGSQQEIAGDVAEHDGQEAHEADADPDAPTEEEEEREADEQHTSHPEAEVAGEGEVDAPEAEGDDEEAGEAAAEGGDADAGYDDADDGGAQEHEEQHDGAAHQLRTQGRAAMLLGERSSSPASSVLRQGGYASTAPAAVGPGGFADRGQKGQARLKPRVAQPAARRRGFQSPDFVRHKGPP